MFAFISLSVNLDNITIVKLNDSMVLGNKYVKNQNKEVIESHLKKKSLVNSRAEELGGGLKLQRIT